MQILSSIVNFLWLPVSSSSIKYSCGYIKKIITSENNDMHSENVNLLLLYGSIIPSKRVASSSKLLL